MNHPETSDAQVPAQPVVCARSLGLSYAAGPVLRDVHLDVGPGAQLALTGRSGGGKTTLLLLLAGLLEPTTGSLTWPGLPSSRTERRAEIGMVFQAPSLMPELSAVENVTLPLRLRGTPRAEARAAATRALALVAALDLTDALPHQLSGGQQQRVAIARVLAGSHRLVLADEPTGSLDRAHARAAVLALRDGVAATGGALVLATHDLEIASLLDEQVTVVDGTVRAAMRQR